MKRIAATLAVTALALTNVGFALADTADYTYAQYGLGPYVESVESAQAADVPIYYGDVENVSLIELLTLNGMDDIPYVSLTIMVDIMNGLYQDMYGFGDYSLSISDEGTGLILVTRDNGALMAVDTDMHTIEFSDPDLFVRTPGAVNGMDINHIIETDPEEGVVLYESTSLLYRDRGSLTYNLDDYDIYMYVQDGEVYLPLQTFSDIMLSPAGEYALFNGQCVIITDSMPLRYLVDAEILYEASKTDEMTEEDLAELRVQCEELALSAGGGPGTLPDAYYSGEQHARSMELCVFNYNELCMALDHTYGLKEEHGIDSFDEFFKETGYAEALLDEDAISTFNVIGEMCYRYLADKHSVAGSYSYLTGSFSGAYFLLEPYEEALFEASSEYYPEGIPGYEEVGNTAFITFNEFTLSDPYGYYDAEYDEIPEDTIALIIYANQQINREGSPIENVVIDLTQNGGGAIVSATCVVSWVTGSCDFQMTDALTGTQGIVSYKFDANLDHAIDEQDCLTTANGNIKGVYCLISPLSFSCGNMVPSAFKGSPNVTLIGRTSGGGACAIITLSTADGTVFTISSTKKLSTVKNGTFYSVDQGVDPDVYIFGPSRFLVGSTGGQLGEA